jgi:ATP/ADP translocase
MHRILGSISTRIVEVRPGEGRKVWWTFLYFFLIITAYYVIKPVSRALALEDLGSHLIPYGDLISAILMGPLVALFARLVDRFDKPRLVRGTFWAVAGCLVVFWRMLHWSNKWVAAAFYVWVAIFSVLVVTLFWLVANDLYHSREGKRLFGFIGSGGILGGITGSSIAALGAKLVGTEQLLLVSSALIVAAGSVVGRLWGYRTADSLSDGSKQRHTTYASSPTVSVWRALRGSRYLALLVGLVLIDKIVATLIYYQFNPFIEHAFPDQDTKTAFMGVFLGWLNIAAFAIQFFLTSWMLRRVGLAFALLVMPLGLMAGSVGLMLMPMFWLAAGSELFSRSMDYSLQQTTKEVLYLPIDRAIRYKVKPFIDMVVFRFGKGLAAVIGIVVLDWLHLPARVLSEIAIPLIMVWVGIAIALRRDYIKTIRQLLQARATTQRNRGADLEELLRQQHLSPAGKRRDLLEWLESLGPSDPVQAKLACISQLLLANGSIGEHGQPLLDALTAYEQTPQPPAHWAPSVSFEDLKACLQDVREPIIVRRYAVTQLVSRGGQETVDALLGLLVIEEDTAMRQELIKGLAALRLGPMRLEFPKPLIRRQITKEVHGYQRIGRVAAIYRRGSASEVGTIDPLVSLLRLLMEEATQHLFLLLSLIYRPEDIYLIYRQIREPDTYVRADAIELLDNVLDANLRWVMVPVLDENLFLERLEADVDDAPMEGDAHRVLQEGLWDHHRWLSVVIMCVIGRLRVEPLMAELTKATEHPNPVVRMTAHVAHRLDPATPPTSSYS